MGLGLGFGLGFGVSPGMLWGPPPHPPSANRAMRNTDNRVPKRHDLFLTLTTP